MLKVELEARVEALEQELEEKKQLAKETVLRAIEENCSDALPYASKLNEDLDLGITKEGYICMDIKIPLDILIKYNDSEIGREDIKLMIDGKEIKIDSSTGIEES